MKRRKRDDDIERELRDHLDLEAEEQREGGLSPDDARNAAHRALLFWERVTFPFPTAALQHGRLSIPVIDRDTPETASTL